MLQIGFNGSDLAEQVRAPLLFLGSIRRDVRFMRIIQEREHAVIFIVREWIIFMRMALGALNGQPEDTLADRVHAIEHGFHSELLGINAAFLVDHGIAEESGRDVLVLRSVRQFVTGDLLDDEAVVRKVAVDRVDNPVAVKPDEPELILFITVAVGIARGIEPEGVPSARRNGVSRANVPRAGNKRQDEHRRRRRRPRRAWGAGR